MKSVGSSIDADAYRPGPLSAPDRCAVLLRCFFQDEHLAAHDQGRLWEIEAQLQASGRARERLMASGVWLSHTFPWSWVFW